MLSSTTILMLVGIVAFGLLGCLVVLLAVAPNRRSKSWAAVFLISYLLWAGVLAARPAWAGLGWLYLWPLLWIALTFVFSFPGSPTHEYPVSSGEPRFTQEQLQGRSGTRQVLNYYFAILTISLLVTLVFLYSAFFR